jgi:hypothetical protein
MAAATAVPENADDSSRRGESTYDNLSRVIALLDMAQDKKEWMKDRWLDQVRWFDKKAAQANRRHSYLRVIAITGGVLVPGLESVNPARDSFWFDWVRPLAFVVSLLVAAAVGLDGFFRYGDRWRHFRRTAELLKIEGWLFIEGGGRYKQYQHRRDFHDRFFPVFATKVEDLVKRDVEVYLTRIVQEKQEDRDQEEREMRAHFEAGDGPEPQMDPEHSGSSGRDPTVAASTPE